MSQRLWYKICTWQIKSYRIILTAKSLNINFKVIKRRNLCVFISLLFDYSDSCFAFDDWSNYLFVYGPSHGGHQSSPQHSGNDTFEVSQDAILFVDKERRMVNAIEFVRIQLHLCLDNVRRLRNYGG